MWVVILALEWDGALVYRLLFADELGHGARGVRGALGLVGVGCKRLWPMVLVPEVEYLRRSLK